GMLQSAWAVTTPQMMGRQQAEALASMSPPGQAYLQSRVAGLEANRDLWLSTGERVDMRWFPSSVRMCAVYYHALARNATEPYVAEYFISASFKHAVVDLQSDRAEREKLEMFPVRLHDAIISRPTRMTESAPIIAADVDAIFAAIIVLPDEGRSRQEKRTNQRAVAFLSESEGEGASSSEAPPRRAPKGQGACRRRAKRDGAATDTSTPRPPVKAGFKRRA
ncbi:hypothetical protein, partial [Bosea sp. (in: a-proteobacteria)]|uniref:hypothetical protein n=1 Tax=Bosea sp. (in: a-proteobacteria) TaxID=1871050 RepID=UPI0025B91BE6